MPRGFLVKRSRKSTLVSYRIRSEDAAEPPPVLETFPVPASGSPRGLSSGGPAWPPEEDQPPPPPPVASPVRPVSREHGPRFLNLASPVGGESFPKPAAPFAGALDRALLLGPADGKVASAYGSAPGRPAAPPHQHHNNNNNSCSGGGSAGQNRGSQVAKAAAPKKAKAIRKLNFEDEVTTSPVLGLKIKEGPVEAKPRSGSAGGGFGASGGGGGGKPLGEFICQLCKEEYIDPFSLAQHKCSRIVRVEYRCPECDKVFSCPANLASHRRWHKPRGQTPSAAGGHPLTSSATNTKGEPGKPSPGEPPAKELRPEAGDRDTPSPGSAPSESGSEDGLYECHRCGKKFRRQAYLRKHLAAHPGDASSYPPFPGSAGAGGGGGGGEAPEKKLPAPGQVSKPGSEYQPCQLCGENFPSKTSQERHLRLHASEVFPCKYCPATFYSSPGLTRHINKCHPSENRQVILLQMPVRPAC
ncbi:insulinoma-associated protein 1b-like [Rhincodon typus]|uniref:insulinoma-associated protein 1b-like n=1 Tax=Rhincodon typus TaxID=259920 RepID=UPI00202FFCC7|nr:insulinoma-associated protein 1b-like [Rhincodon typus]XP_048457046.1 insulinoma-associated protein 1b-like [Rhincodon typus]XP_048457047.1 insulinoma-associated protein 1b-like [Rhincodon typus]